VDLSKLTTSDKVIAGSGIVLFIASLLPWFRISAGGGIISYSWSGWDVGFFWGGIPALLGILSAGIVIATKLGSVQLPKVSVTTGQAMLIAGAVSAAIVVLKLLTGYHSVSRAYGLYLATVAALGLLGGGFLAFNEEKAASPSSS
jgi:hypothetical protein